MTREELDQSIYAYRRDHQGRLPNMVVLSPEDLLAILIETHPRLNTEPFFRLYRGVVLMCSDEL